MAALDPRGQPVTGRRPVCTAAHWVPMEGYGPATYGDGFADVYDNWYRDMSDVAATVSGVRKLADGGPILELGVGTGRLAIPLVEAGESVVGLDASAAMLARLMAKPGGSGVMCVEADMAELPVATSHFALAFAAFNTFFNLTDSAAQQRCLEGVAGALRPCGRLVIEGFRPPVEGLNDSGLSVRSVSVDGAVVTVSRHDPGRQEIRGHHVELSATGIRLRPWMLHYRTPDQLDSAATAAGFVHEARWADWKQTPITDHSDMHVSVYRLDSRR